MTTLAVCDVETTGLDPSAGHRIIEIGILLVDYPSFKPVGKYEQRINPMRSIDKKAFEAHGISLLELAECPVWEAVAKDVRHELSKADVMVCHNADFDVPFVAMELMRVGLTPPDLQTFCTMESGRWATCHGKNPTLRELCFACGVPYDPLKAHGAMYDLLVTTLCLKRGIAAGMFKLPLKENP